MAIFSTAIVFLIHFFIKHSRLKLFIAGLLLGFATLTKGIVGKYLLILLVIVFVFTVFSSESKSSRKKTINKALSYCAILFFTVWGLTFPQKLMNFAFYDFYGISTNTWFNIEWGITPDYDMKKYFDASEDARTRELQAKERVFNFVQENGILSIVARQVKQFVHQQLYHSFIIRGFNIERWENTNSTFFKTLIPIFTMVLSWAIFLFGLAGVFISQSHRNFIRAIVAAFILYYLFSLQLVGFNARFFVQVLPFLGIYAAFFIEAAWIGSKHASIKTNLDSIPKIQDN